MGGGVNGRKYPLKFWFVLNKTIIEISKREENYLDYFKLAANLFLEAFFIGSVVVLSPKIVMNLPRTYEKLPCKEEPDRLSG